MTRKRCPWASHNQRLKDYHDHEWGKPIHDDQTLFEFLCLETYQAGLSWDIVLKKRQAFREAFYDYDLLKVAAMTDQEIDELLSNTTIIRHKRKLFATRENARAILSLKQSFGSFDQYIWSFVDARPICHHFKSERMVPSQNELSDTIAKDLKKHDFQFLGSKTVYAYLQAIGVINDHLSWCDFKEE